MGLDIFIQSFTSDNLPRLLSSSIFLYSSALHIMVKYLNLEHSIKNVFFLKYRMKHFACDKISAQISSFPQGQEWNGSKLAFSQLAGIPSVAPQLVNCFWPCRPAYITVFYWV